MKNSPSPKWVIHRQTVLVFQPSGLESERRLNKGSESTRMATENRMLENPVNFQWNFPWECIIGRWKYLCYFHIARVCVKIVYSKGSSVSSRYTFSVYSFAKKKEKCYAHFENCHNFPIYNWHFHIVVLFPEFYVVLAVRLQKGHFPILDSTKNRRINDCNVHCAIFMTKKWLCFQFHCTQWFESINRKWEMSM